MGTNPITQRRERKHKKNFTSYGEAEQWANEITAEYERNGKLKPAGVTFKEVYDEWLRMDYENRVKESTCAKTIDIFRLHILPYFETKQATNISVSFCQSVVNQWFNDGLKQYQRFRTYVIMVFDFGIRMEFLTRNPMDNTSIPKNKNRLGKSDIEFYNKTELNHFLTCAKSYGNEEAFMFFRLLSYSGLRKSEALALKFSDINFDTNEISINKTLSQGHEWKTVLQTPKTRSSARTITVDTSTIDYLRKWQSSITRDMTLLGLHKDGEDQIIFPSTKNHYLQPSAPDHWNRQICNKFKLRRISIHSFRHTFCSLCAESGENITTISKMLGHSSLKTTTEIYLHVTNNARQEAVNHFANFMTS